MQLNEFVGDVLKPVDSRPGRDLSKVGPGSEWLRERIGPERTEALVATSFWQAFMDSPALARLVIGAPALREQGVMPSLVVGAEKIVVARSDIHRYDLLALLPVPIEPTAVRVEASSADVVGAFPGFPAPSQRPRVRGVARRLAIEAIRAEQPFAMVFASKPPTTFAAGVPATCPRVTAGSLSGSVGLVVRRKLTGDKGITTAVHVTAGATVSAGAPRQVDVAGKTGTIELEDVISDTAFVKLDPADLPSTGNRGSQGVMTGKLPRGQEKVTFRAIRPDDATGQPVSVDLTAYVTGWSQELPDVDLLNQLKVYTTLATQGGDSGTAIVTDADDYIVGFAHERCDHRIQYSSWIWAEAALLAVDAEVV
jgi:hypothetical protein